MESRTRPIPTTSIARPTTRRREVELDGLTWIDLPQPVNTDIAYLRERLRLDTLALDDVLSTIQLPKLDVHEAHEYLFVVVQVPVFDRDQRPTVSEIDIFAGRDFVVTIHDSNVKPLRRLFAAAAGDEAARKQVLGRGSGYLLYRVLDTLIKQSFPVIYHLDEQIGQFEQRLLTSDPEKLLPAQAQLERDSLALRHMLSPNRSVCDALRHLDLPFLKIDAERFFGDIGDGAHKLSALADEQHERIVAAGRVVLARSVQQQGLAQRTMALALVLLVPLALVAALAALAVALPPLTLPIPFGAAVALMLLLVGGVYGVARRQKWF